MPRKGKGGRRTGTQGRSYPNRQDLQRNSQPVQTGPSQGYGQRVAQERAQQAQPLPAQPPPPAPGVAPTPGGAPESPAPGTLGAFNRPSERPGEPITTGTPMGAGAGPEVLGRNRRGDPDLEAMRAYLPTLELLASLPNTSPTARNFVRRLRGTMPPAPPGA